jgi:hypothetical protein
VDWGVNGDLPQPMAPHPEYPHIRTLKTDCSTATFRSGLVIFLQNFAQWVSRVGRFSQPPTASEEMIFRRCSSNAFA